MTMPSYSSLFADHSSFKFLPSWGFDGVLSKKGGVACLQKIICLRFVMESVNVIQVITANWRIVLVPGRWGSKIPFLGGHQNFIKDWTMKKIWKLMEIVVKKITFLDGRHKRMTFSIWILRSAKVPKIPVLIDFHDTWI